MNTEPHPVDPARVLRELLAPVDPARFFAEHWERAPLVVRGGAPARFEHLLSLADIDRVLTTLSLHHPEVSVVDAARSLSKDEYTYPSGLIDAARLYQRFADGGTVILQNLEARLPALADLCRAMEAALSARFQTNIYLTPPRAQGFKTHYDSHDVFVLQVRGTKRWALYDTPVELPYRGQRFRPEAATPGAVSLEFDLGPGDVAYVPRGVMHDATTGDELSLHVTLGVLPSSWTDLLVEALAAAGLRDPAFRKALPPGFAREGFDRAAARETFRELWKRAADLADFDAALDHFVDDLVSTRHPLLHGQMDQVAALEALTPASVVGARPNLLYRAREEGEQVAVACYGNTLRFPRHAGEALRFALAHESFAVRELPGALDDAGKLVLVRRLVREGMLRVLG